MRLGTGVGARTLDYEFRVTTALALEDDGLRCTVRFPLTQRVGQFGEA
jgi:hypothetical protein